MRHPYYILNANKQPLPVDLATWSKWFAASNRVVELTEINSEVEVSTVFLGVDHRHLRGKGPPLLFETMIFGGPMDQECWRYASWDDAYVGHQVAVKKARRRLNDRLAAAHRKRKAKNS